MFECNYVDDEYGKDDAFEIGNRVYECRKAKGLSQSELYVASGIPYKTISSIENGREMPNMKTIVALARALEAPLSVFQPEDLDCFSEITPEVWKVVTALAKEQPGHRREMCRMFLRQLST